MDYPRSIHFGDFVLNRRRGCLQDGAGMERLLRPKSYRVLEVLAERRGQLVSKDDLVQATWPDVFVSDDSLAQCVSDIRRALGPEGTNLLRTVPRRGYLLVGQDSDAEGSAPAGRKHWMVWASGLSAALIVAMTILWWTQPRDGLVAPDLADQAVVKADALLEARDWRRRGDNEQARELLEAVVAEDAGHAGAWSSLGLTYWLEVQHLAWGGGRREMGRALEMVERAVALGGGARPHRLLAEMRLLSPFPEMRSPVDALANARAAVTIDPEDADNLAVLAQALALTGRSDEAVLTIQQALRLSTKPPEWHRQVAGLSYLLAGEPARAAEELGPLYGAGTFAHARWWPGWLFAASLAHAGRLEEAARVVTAALGHRPEQTVAGVAQSFDGLADESGLAILLEGLRLAGMPG
ncbi:winged helix-turn-helix domain-containing protein [Mesorhizobium muleiense]|uniref:DNA-binding winged helix-turn-helix (WHTH) domain-containing protein n=1 Tax=Mesorhizobium muleiense TaxID=1004279 RepID=A0A1G9L380_9HYPH|nr:winged helix-turn-helix domain-containing protein [Mesorhizobium muleiense]MCF6104017.1 winged helix-turn-helix domain-containing protein [Mesorhizobium muleiense]SDL56468.1 DNA-binding winged helix-turn-helix (wHTH) domain-containing protein [Mesorhizobium muleiense]